MAPIVLLIFLLPLGLAAALLFCGFRGLRIGDHPVCRRCAFDLYGSPAGTVVCGECGNDLTQPGTVAIGHHQRRTSFIIGGFVILLPMLFVAGIVLWSQTSTFNWLDYAPTSLVIHRAMSADPLVRSPALAQLNARFTASTLSTGELGKIADAALAYQSDLSKPWDPVWGDWIERCEANGKLSDTRWKQYLNQAWQGGFTFKLRPRVRRGDPLPYVIATNPTRAASNTKLMADMKGLDLTWMSPHGPVPVGGGGGGMGMALGRGMGGGTCGSSLNFTDIPKDMTDGVQTLSYHISVDVGYANTQMWNVVPIVSGQLNLTGSFTLLPADQPTLKIIDDSTMTAAIQKSLQPQIQNGRSSFMVSVNGPPVAVSFDVFVKTGGQEVKAGSFACPAGTTNHGYGMDPHGLPVGPKTVDVIFRSNLDAALNTLDTLEAWKGEIVFKDVPVK